ncbi:MAG: hypothetical protein AABX26_02745 [Nanoarchaeota archaeon]
MTKPIERMFDTEVVAFLAGHIDNPCFTIVNGRKETIRDFYLREAERVLPQLTNPYAIELLQSKIREYRN